MLMNYHELTMHEARNSPARRKQFLVICTVMAAAFVYSVVTAGGLTPIAFETGTFPGGDFCYKTTKRDYAAASSLQEAIGKDMGLKQKELADKVYTIYLDHPGKVKQGRQQRFASGFLAKKGDPAAHKTLRELLGKNDDIKPLTRTELEDLSAFKLWPRLKYKHVSLPKVEAVVVNFPFTNGFVSALMHSLKVIPALRKHASEKTKGPVVVITTCSVTDQMCTHYVPLQQNQKFLLGQPAMEQYLEGLPPAEWFDWEKIQRRFNPTRLFKKKKTESEEL
jgi:hypothetical protein